MTSWIGILFDKLYLFWPLRIVHSYQQGVRFWLGRDIAQLGPGCYLFPPFFGSIEVVDIAEDVLTLPINSITTQDGHAISCSANIVFRIRSARKKYTKVQDFNTSLDALASGHLAACVRGINWSDLHAEQDALEAEVKAKLNRTVRKWGVRVIAVHVTDMVEAKSYRLFGDAMLR